MFKPVTPSVDEYGEVTNSDRTYSVIASELRWNGSCMIGWTDGKYTHYDVLFTYKPKGFGHFQGGVRSSDLMVSVMRIGCFGFAIEDRDLYPGYIGEKVRVGSQEFADLLNGVIKVLLIFEHI